MASRIETYTIGGLADKNVVLDAASFFAPLDRLPADWNSIRIIARLSCEDVGATLTGPNFGCGIANSLTNSDPVWTHANVHRTGYATFNNWTRNAGPPAWYSAISRNFNVIRKNGTGGNSTQTTNQTLSAAPATIRNAVMMEITKGSPNYSYLLSMPTTQAIAQTHVTVLQVESAHQTPSFSDAATALGHAAPASATTLAIDTATNGDFDQIFFYWLRAGVDMSNSDLTFSYQS